jgi:ubiquinone/menaquinone biosynthesis C-methylase UbiE
MSTTKAASEEMNQHFHNQAAIYEKLTGGVTRRIAEGCLQYLPKFTSQSRFLDSASGPGIVTRLILETAQAQGVEPPPHVTAIDFAPRMIDQFKSQEKALGWTTVDSKVLNAENLDGLDDETFDAIVMNLGLFALPNAEKGAKEMWRVLKPRGVAVVTTWKRPTNVELLERTIEAIRPQDVDRVFPVSRDWLKAEKVRNTMVEGGFKSVKVEERMTTWKSGTLGDLLDVMVGSFWQRIWADWSDEDKNMLRPEMMKQLTEDQRTKVELDMTAWVCVAVKE